MRFSHRYRYIFFSNPKTGSESVRLLLTPFNDARLVTSQTATREHPFHAHMRPFDTRAAFANFGWDFDRYYRFTFVRNPWKRLASLYEMIVRLDSTNKKPFDHWLRDSQTDGDGGGPGTWRKYGAYSLKNFAGDDGGKLLVNEVFRLEDIDSLPAVLRARGIPIPPYMMMPRINGSRTGVPYRLRYTPELVQLVADRYADEIAQFGYEF
jgi:hypothetical protein